MGEALLTLTQHKSQQRKPFVKYCPKTDAHYTSINMHEANCIEVANKRTPHIMAVINDR